MARWERAAVGGAERGIVLEDETAASGDESGEDAVGFVAGGAGDVGDGGGLVLIPEAPDAEVEVGVAFGGVGRVDFIGEGEHAGFDFRGWACGEEEEGAFNGTVQTVVPAPGYLSHSTTG